MEENTVFILRLLAACIFLWMAALPDQRSQRIPIWIPGVFLAAAIGANLFRARSFAGWEIGRGALPGAVLLLFSLLLRGKLGEGDGICLAVCGLLTGAEAAVMILEAALILAAITGCAGIWTGKWKAGDRIAFVPFLAAATSLMLIGGALKLL